MPRLLTEDVRKQVRDALEDLKGSARLVHFTQKNACGACREQRRLLEEFAALGDKLELEVFELLEDAGEAKRNGIDKVPATTVVGERDYGIRFYGLTGGYELGSLLEAVPMAAANCGESQLEPDSSLEGGRRAEA